MISALTGEVRAKAERGRAAAGAGVTAIAGGFAVVALAAGYAVSDGERGGQYVASVQRSTPKGGANIALEHFDPGYRQFGASAFEKRPKQQVVAGGGLALGLGVSAGMSYTRRTTWDGARFSPSVPTSASRCPATCTSAPTRARRRTVARATRAAST